MSEIKGVVAILTGPDGHVWATATEFDRSGYGGFSLQEAQELRVKRALAWEFVRKACSDVIVRALDEYQCDRIINNVCSQQGFTRTILPIDHKDIAND